MLSNESSKNEQAGLNEILQQLVLVQVNMNIIS